MIFFVIISFVSGIGALIAGNPYGLIGIGVGVFWLLVMRKSQ